MRTYTVPRLSGAGASRELDIDFVLHLDEHGRGGPASVRRVDRGGGGDGAPAALRPQAVHRGRHRSATQAGAYLGYWRRGRAEVA